MVSTSKMEQTGAVTPVSGFYPHVEELQDFFRSRGLRFGSAEDLEPFMERLGSDESFRDDVSSMIRTIIYRERDGLSRPELMELLATAVGGDELNNTASPEVRDAVRRLMAFIEGVFRTRLDPGAGVLGAGSARPYEAPPEAGTAENASAVHPTTDVFYRAQVVANAGVAEPFADDWRAEESVTPAVESNPLEEDPESEHQWHIPLEDFASSNDREERGSRAWLWVAGVCALLLAFSAGVFVHQRMLVPLRDASQPYEAPPPQPAATTVAQPPAAPVPVAPRSGTTVDADWRARAASSRSRVVAPVGAAGVRSGRAGAEPASERDVPPRDVAQQRDLEPRVMVPGMIGASPALMASYLIYAPPTNYPALARMTHIQGKVMVEAVVGKNGQVLEARAISGHHLLRGAAVREVYERRYRPYLLDDRPRDVATIVTVDFRLK